MSLSTLEVSGYGSSTVDMNDIAKIMIQSLTFVMLKKDGSFRSMGGDLHAHSNFNDELINIVDVSCGRYSCVVLRSDGVAYSWGHQSHGFDRFEPYIFTHLIHVSCGYTVCLGVKQNGTIVQFVPLTFCLLAILDVA